MQKWHKRNGSQNKQVNKPTDIVKTVHIHVLLMAISWWIKQPWEEAKLEAITTCITHYGAFPQKQCTEDLLLTSQNNDFIDEDDANIGLQQVVDGLGSDMCAEERMTADDDLHVCTCMSLEDWNK